MAPRKIAKITVPARKAIRSKSHPNDGDEGAIVQIRHLRCWFYKSWLSTRLLTIEIAVLKSSRELTPLWVWIFFIVRISHASLPSMLVSLSGCLIGGC